MASMIELTPHLVQVRYRVSFEPPGFEVVVTDNALRIAGQFAAAFKMNAASIIFNQAALSTQYISFKNFKQLDPLRYIEATLGADQLEVFWNNPLQFEELKQDLLSTARPVVELLSERTLLRHHFEATLQCSLGDVRANEFLDEHVKIEPRTNTAHKGFMVTLEDAATLSETYISVQGSKSIENGLFVFFTRDAIAQGSLEEVFDTAIAAYRSIQQDVEITILEPS